MKYGDEPGQLSLLFRKDGVDGGAKRKKMCTAVTVAAVVAILAEGVFAEVMLIGIVHVIGDIGVMAGHVIGNVLPLLVTVIEGRRRLGNQQCDQQIAEAGRSLHLRPEAEVSPKF
ncbi:hypothetical protein [Microbulbifer hainanensis]|uniref:hypothetical protein n=1 Tax=Microbulbifer hainanensis TaxID=2735675 RepID=UPI0018667548|nr:hypothetical protein [Microbulbifer hainanensis]